tara:strand:+ start:695 stop:1354 length:660 start_codon:yes stop_codon:yes gene_type:complete
MEEIFPALGAGVVSTIICNPLDTIRVNYQLNNKIQYNLKFLYRGISYGIIAIPSFWAIYFPVYKKLKDSELSKPISAYIACCMSSTFTTPFWVLRQKLQTGKKINNANILNLYRGIIPTYIINLNFTVQMPLYEYLKDKTNNSTFNTFLNTSISKTVATCIFYPIDTIRVKIRNNDSFILKPAEYYRGMSIYLIRSIPYHVTVFCSYEFIKSYFTKNFI